VKPVFCLGPGVDLESIPGVFVANVKPLCMVHGGFILFMSTNIWSLAELESRDRAEVRSLFSSRSGAEFGRMANRVRTGCDFVSRAATRLGWTSGEELYARHALEEAVKRMGLKRGGWHA